MRAPTPTAAGIAAQAHYEAVVAIIGSDPQDTVRIMPMSKADHAVYSHYTGTPEAVAARILDARKQRQA